MKISSVTDIYDFLNFLDEKHIWYDIRHTIPDSLTVMIYLPCLRIEVEFYPKRVDYTVFSGDESVESDFEKLLKLILDD